MALELTRTQAPFATPQPPAPSKKEMLDQIVKMIGATEARSLIMGAYNTEIMSNRIGRMEGKTGIAERFEKKDLLGFAITRVFELVTLMD